MGDFLLNVGAGATCPHGGTLQIVPASVKVLGGGQPLATVGDQFLIAGCAFTVPTGKPQPCVSVTFVPATKVLIGGQPAVLKASVGICQSAEQIPQGSVIVSSTQVKVQGV